MGEASHGNDHSNPFASLEIWRNKVASDLRELPQTEDFKLRVLLEQGKDCEQAVWGCLKDALSELHEGQEWGLLPREFAAQQHMRLYNLAAQELLNDKEMIVQLAHEHDIAEAYSHAVKQGQHHTVVDYERIGELRFAMLAWRANLLRDLSVCGGRQQAELLLREECHAVARLIRRCAHNSGVFWAAQQAHDAPGAAERRAVWDAAWPKAQHVLVEAAERHHIAKDALAQLQQELEKEGARE